jgi:hypothetical protein
MHDVAGSHRIELVLAVYRHEDAPALIELDTLALYLLFAGKYHANPTPEA